MSRDFLLRRLHSLLGVIPLFIFIPVHMLQKAIPYLTLELREPVRWLVLLTGIAPFLLHAALGVYIKVKNKVSPFQKTRGIMFRLQILSSPVILIFVMLHKYLFNLLWSGAGYAAFVATALLFAVSIPAIAFHMGYGTFTFCVTWGLCVGKEARGWVKRAAVALGLLFGAGGLTLYVFVFISLKGLLFL